MSNPPNDIERYEMDAARASHIINLFLPCECDFLCFGRRRRFLNHHSWRCDRVPCNNPRFIVCIATCSNKLVESNVLFRQTVPTATRSHQTWAQASAVFRRWHIQTWSRHANVCSIWLIRHIYNVKIYQFVEIERQQKKNGLKSVTFVPLYFS